MRKLQIALVAAVCAPAFMGSPARADLQDVAKAMGSPDQVQMSGSGLMFGLGQAYKAGMPWPKLNLLKYSRTDDYAHAAQSYETTVNRADQLGGTATPQRGEVRRGGGVVGDQAWQILYPATNPVAAGAAPLQHDLWISPHGILKAALADKAAMSGSTFAIERAGKFKARATVGPDNLVTRVDSIVDNPVLGDMAVVTTYADYKDFGGVKFPTRILQSQGGQPVLELTVTDVKVNTGAITAPAEIGRTVDQVKLEKAADGVWFIGGGSHNSVAVEMKEYIVLVDSPLGDGRANAAIKAVKDAVPNKSIRYVVISHHHFDHAGGLRAAAAEGATIVLPEMSRSYFEQAYATPHTLNPDSLAKSGKKAKFEGYRGDKHTISDGTRTIEIHLMKNNIHADGFAMIYLPKEKILMLADAFSPRQAAPITSAPAFINPATLNLYENIVRLKLPVETILPMHGRIAKFEELKAEAGVR